MLSRLFASELGSTGVVQQDPGVASHNFLSECHYGTIAIRSHGGDDNPPDIPARFNTAGVDASVLPHDIFDQFALNFDGGEPNPPEIPNKLIGFGPNPPDIPNVLNLGLAGGDPHPPEIPSVFTYITAY